MRLKLPDYFMAIALIVSLRGTCDEKRVGAIVAKGKYVIATGYNGSIAGAEHCDDVGHEIDSETGRCVRTVHAEANAIANAARLGASVEGTDLYTTHFPCWECFRLAINAGISRIFFGEKPQEMKEHYKRVYDNAEKLNIKLIEIPTSNLNEHFKKLIERTSQEPSQNQAR